jgi:hypothetical protein
MVFVKRSSVVLGVLMQELVSAPKSTALSWSVNVVANVLFVMILFSSVRFFISEEKRERLQSSVPSFANQDDLQGANEGRKHGHQDGKGKQHLISGEDC